MKKILGLAFAGAMLIACGSSNKNATGMQNTTASTTEPSNMPATPSTEAAPSSETPPSTQAPLTEPTPPSTQPMPNSTGDQNMNQNQNQNPAPTP